MSGLISFLKNKWQFFKFTEPIGWFFVIYYIFPVEINLYWNILNVTVKWHTQQRHQRHKRIDGQTPSLNQCQDSKPRPRGVTVSMNALISCLKNKWQFFTFTQPIGWFFVIIYFPLKLICIENNGILHILLNVAVKMKICSDNKRLWIALLAQIVKLYWVLIITCTGNAYSMRGIVAIQLLPAQWIIEHIFRYYRDLFPIASYVYFTRGQTKREERRNGRSDFVTGVHINKSFHSYFNVTNYFSSFPFN